MARAVTREPQHQNHQKRVLVKSCFALFCPFRSWHACSSLCGPRTRHKHAKLAWPTNQLSQIVVSFAWRRLEAASFAGVREHPTAASSLYPTAKLRLDIYCGFPSFENIDHHVLDRTANVCHSANRDHTSRYSRKQSPSARTGYAQIVQPLEGNGRRSSATPSYLRVNSALFCFFLSSVA